MTRTAFDPSAVDALLDALPRPAAPDAVAAPLPVQPAAAPEGRPRARRGTPRRERPAAEVTDEHREKLSVEVPGDLAERARRVCYWVPATTLTKLVVEGLERMVAAYEKQHGGPFPERRGPIRTGRPLNTP